MIEEPIATGSSPIHRINPRLRILMAVFLSVACALSRDMVVLPGYLVTALVLVALARIPLDLLLRRIRPLFWFVLMIWLIVPVTFSGDTLYQYKILVISRQGVDLCLLVSLKSVSILMIFTALIATMTVATLGNGLHFLRVPDKMVFLLLMAYRYVDVIENECKRLLRAAKFRGFIPGTNVHSYRTYAYLAGMLFVRAATRANRVYHAMICRGFSGRFHTLDVYPPNRLNYIFLTLTLITGLALIGAELFGIPL